MDRPEKKKTSSPLLVAASWLFVLTPMGWGVYQSVVKSLPLFQTPAATSTTASSANADK